MDPDQSEMSPEDIRKQNILKVALAMQAGQAINAGRRALSGSGVTSQGSTPSIVVNRAPGADDYLWSTAQPGIAVTDNINGSQSGDASYLNPRNMNGAQWATRLNQNWNPSGPSTLSSIGTDWAAAGFPTMPKPIRNNGTIPRMGPATKRTSIWSTVMHDTPLNKMFTEPAEWTPMFSKIGAESRKLATIAERRAPIVGYILTALDLAASKNKLRTLAGDVGGLAGSAIGTAGGAALGSLAGGVGAVPLAVAGDIGGGYVGNELGLKAYDYFAGN